MQASTERRRHSRTRKLLPQTLRISYSERTGEGGREFFAKLIDTSEFGCRISLGNSLPVGSLVFADCQIPRADGRRGLIPARVTWCSLESNGTYSAGLVFEPAGTSDRPGTGPQPESASDGFTDYYELLQLSPKADAETVHRVYRMLAQRLHPDNPSTGSEEVFKRLLEAYRVLSDPEQRAGYDARHSQHLRRRWKIFNQESAAHGREAERRKRAGILWLLYTRRVNEPSQPGMSIHELEDLLGCPREHLEFSLWFLREKALLTRSDHGRYAITASGVEYAEAADTALGQQDHLLPPPQKS
jgi:hypothetical protein